MFTSLSALRGRNARRTGSCIVLASMLLASCSRWEPVTGASASGLDSRQDQLARVTLRDGRHLYLWFPRVANDSLQGMERRTVPRHLRSSTDRAIGYREYDVAVPLSAVQSVAFSQPDGQRTALLGGLVIGFLIVASIAASQLDFDISGPDSGPLFARPR